MMAQNQNRNGDTSTLNPRRNECVERKKLFEEMLLKEMPGRSRANEPMHAVLEGELSERVLLEGQEYQNVRNLALIHYLATLANSNRTSDRFDFDFVESLLNNGADISSTDKTGQTVFHEVARSWNIDVATFLIKHGANVNQQDQYGRSPLHVAAAVDYAEMVEFLLQNGADIDIQTNGEGQAAIHYAAKNDAINSLQMLLGYGADIDARDSKNRTPLQVSAEMNRSKAAKILIAEGAPAGVYDDLGNSALSLLIEKIPEVALDAMHQFHSVDTINRKEFYFLNYLEATKLTEQKTPARTPLEIAVQNERFDVIMHPVMQRLISVKWQMYGKWGAILDLVINVVYTILWTVLAVTLPKYGRDLYLPHGETAWRLIIGILLILFTVLEIRKQVMNTMKTRHELKQWREWRAAELERDLAYCHPRWPQEAQYLQAEIKAVRNLSLISGSDWWIYFDWAAVVLILATIASHVTFFHFSNDTSKEVHHYILIPLLLVLWFRILKYARPFESAGPFVVIFGHILGDIVKWAFLNSIIVIPFTCAFWITFGAISLNPVPGYDTAGPLLYNIFSMMVVSSHDYDNLEEANPVMARLLCGAFIGIAAIVTLNLLIALLSNTFERLYENAVENAVMQRARTILLLQKSLRKKQKKKYYDFIKTNGSPEVIVKTLGRLLTIDGDDHVTIERVHEDVKFIVKILGEKFGRKFGKGKKSDLDFVKMDVSKIRRFQEELMVDVKNVQDALQKITEKVKKIDNTGVSDMKQMLQETTVKIEEIKDSIGKNNNSSTNTVLTGSNLETQSTKPLAKRDHSDRPETESSETESENDDVSTCEQDGKFTKRRNRNKQNDHKAHSKHQYQPSSTNPDTWQPNAGVNNSQFSYPTSYGVGSRNKYDVASSFGTSNANDQTPYGTDNRWFATAWPNNKSVFPQDDHGAENPLLLQRHGFTQQPNCNSIPPNSNLPLSLYDMKQADNLYSGKSSPNINPPQVKYVTSLQSPYTTPLLENNRFQQTPFESYGHQNQSNGFQSDDPDMHQSDMSDGYREMGLNYPMVSYAPSEQPGSQRTPLTQGTITSQQTNRAQQHQTTPVQSVSEKEVANEENELETAIADHGNYHADSGTEINVSENEIPTDSVVMQNNNTENYNNQCRRPSTLISQQIKNRITFYEERIATIHTTKQTATIKGGKEEIDSTSTPNTVEPSSPSAIRNDEPGDPGKNIDTTEVTSDSEASELATKNSNFEPHSVSDEQSGNIEEYRNSSTSQETTEDSQDTPTPSNDLDVKNEITEGVPPWEISDPLSPPLDEEIFGELKI